MRWVSQTFCNSCGQKPFWNGKPLTLTLEHKNGVFNDHRLENLEILCGHCHSQTDTFAGRSGDRKRNPTNYCECGKEINYHSTNCYSCSAKKNLERDRGYTVIYPPIEQLVDRVKETSFVKVAKTLKVSDNGLRNHMKKELPDFDIIFNVRPRKSKKI